MDSPPRPFRLLEFFKLTSLVAFGLMAVAFYVLERFEFKFFDEMQDREEAMVVMAQTELVSAQRAAARASLVMEYEASHLALTTVLSNALWESRLDPLLTQAGPVPLDATAGRLIRALPAFAPVDAAVHRTMKGSNVFKIKVYDLRGLTIYSSELAQVGEDKSDNAGWKQAATGKPASEIVHRKRFGTFEGVVEDRDLIQSYVPMRRRDGQIVGVFEIYSDADSLLKRLDEVTEQASGLAAANLAKVRQESQVSRRTAESNSNVHFAIVFTLLVGLYSVIYLLVRRGQRIIDEEAAAREAAALREQNWHREKMAALATMAANTSHEIGNPLAIISGLAEDMARAAEAGEPLKSHAGGILEQTWRIAEMTRRITDFASARSETPELVDVNAMIEALRYFLSFDERYRLTWVEVEAQPDLPPAFCIPDHLNEVLMNLLQTYAEDSLKARSLVRVQTFERERGVVTRLGFDAPQEASSQSLAADARVMAARRRVECMGGQFVITGSRTEIWLPGAPPPAQTPAAGKPA